MQQLNSGTAYIFWCLWLFGLGGAHRFYTGNVGIGLIYLFTWGLFGFGQVIDLVLIPGMVDKRNLYLRGLHGSRTSNVTQQVTLNIGDIPQLKPLQTTQPASEASTSPMQRLLKAAKENGGQLSIAQAAMHTQLETEQLKGLLEDATKAGYAEISNDAKSGAIRYHFDV